MRTGYSKTDGRYYDELNCLNLFHTFLKCRDVF